MQIRFSFFMALALASAAPAGAQPVATPPAQAAPTPVQVVAVMPGLANTPVSLPARAAPSAEARLHTRATGTIKSRAVDLGDFVEAGQVLAEVAAPEVDFQVEKARASVAQAAAKARLAEAELKRATALGPAKAISTGEVESSEASAGEARANVLAAEAECRRLEATRDFQTLRAPFSGTIAARQIDVGDQVRGDQSADNQWLYHLVKLDPLRIDVDAPPLVALAIAPGAVASLAFRDLPGKVFTATLARSARIVDADSGTVRLEFTLPNPDQRVPAGLPGTARVTLPAPPDSLLVPGNAILTREGQSLVVVVVDNRAKFTRVTTGRNLGDRVEVLAGLDPSAIIVSNPNALLRDGDPVAPGAIPANAR